MSVAPTHFDDSRAPHESSAMFVAERPCEAHSLSWETAASSLEADDELAEPLCPGVWLAETEPSLAVDDVPPGVGDAAGDDGGAIDAETVCGAAVGGESSCLLMAFTAKNEPRPRATRPTVIPAVFAITFWFDFFAGVGAADAGAAAGSGSTRAPHREQKEPGPGAPHLGQFIRSLSSA